MAPFKPKPNVLIFNVISYGVLKCVVTEGSVCLLFIFYSWIIVITYDGPQMMV